MNRRKMLCLFGLLVVCWGQAIAQDLLRVDRVPVGARPLGVEIAPLNPGSGPVFVVVANSGDDSVAILEARFESRERKVIPVAVARDIPAPYAVSICRASTTNSDRVIVTSPSKNSISVLELPSGRVRAVIQVGSRPYSAACFFTVTGPKAVISNAGDNTLSLIDLNTLAVTATIPGVPGSLGLHGVTVATPPRGNPIAWVAGTESNVVTLVDLAVTRILTRVPVGRPMTARTVECFDCPDRGLILIASASDSTLFFYSSLTYTAEPPELSFKIVNVPVDGDAVRSVVWSSSISSTVALRYGLGDIATVGGRDAVARVMPGESGSSVTSLIAGIPAAAGVAAFSWLGHGSGRVPAIPMVFITSPSTNSLFFLNLAPFELAIKNAASFGTAVSTSSLATLFRIGANTTGLGTDFSAGTVPLPTTLGSVRVRVGGNLEFVDSRWMYSGAGATAAPLLFAGIRQVNFQVPPETSPSGAVPVQLEYPDGSALVSTFPALPAAPGIFSTAEGPAAVLNQDNSLNSTSHPALRGTIIQIFATGAGPTNPPLPAGEAAPASGNPLILTSLQPVVTIDGKPARVLFSGLAPGLVGVWQINAEVPQIVRPGPAVPLVLAVGRALSNAVVIAVE